MNLFNSPCLKSDLKVLYATFKAHCCQVLTCPKCLEKNKSFPSCSISRNGELAKKHIPDPQGNLNFRYIMIHFLVQNEIIFSISMPPILHGACYTKREKEK